MIFLSPYYHELFWMVFAPFILGVMINQLFAKPLLRSWWLVLMTIVWFGVCACLCLVLWYGGSARFMDPYTVPPFEMAVRISGGWLLSGLVILWGPELFRRWIQRGSRHPA